MAKYRTVQTTTINCPACQSDHVVKIGKRAGYQRYLCRACSKSFHDNGNAPGKRFTANQMGAAVRMFYSGLSYKQIGENMAEQYDIPEPSKATIYDWVKDYTDVAVREMKDHKAHTGEEWVADEMQLKVGGEKYWNWNVMDSDTRYILASYLSKRRDSRAAATVMRKAARSSANLPKTIKTDKLRSYEDGIERVFGGDVKHVQSEGIRAELNNNRSERLQGTFRQRTKTLRGLDSRDSGQLYLDGWTLTYNLFREHESLRNKTPASAAKVTTPFESWESVVESASLHSTVIPQVVVTEPEAKQTTTTVEVNGDAVVKVKEPTRAPKGEKRSTSKIRPVKPKGKRSKTQTSLRNTVPYHPFLTRRERGR